MGLNFNTVGDMISKAFVYIGLLEMEMNWNWIRHFVREERLYPEKQSCRGEKREIWSINIMAFG